MSRLFTLRHRVTTTIDCTTAIALSVTSLRVARRSRRAQFPHGSERNVFRLRLRPRSVHAPTPPSMAHDSLVHPR
jgi:hypothetical protein